MFNFHTILNRRLGRKTPSVQERSITISGLEKPISADSRFNCSVNEWLLFPVWKRLFTPLPLPASDKSHKKNDKSFFTTYGKHIFNYFYS